MTTDFSLMDIMGNFTGGPANPADMPDYASTATTQPVAGEPITAEPKKSYINPKFLLKTSAVAPTEAAPTPAAPVVPSSYNASIAQQESGNRPDIGFHDKKKSTAFGTYGLTSGAYQDARKLNPTLPEDITQATPEQQTQAQNAFTQQNAKYLKNFGIEPTQNNLAAAHFLGAKGLSDYLRDGTISPAAARANGGEDKVREIVNKRLGGQLAPASGAVQPTAPAAAPAEPAVAAVSPEAAAAQPPAPVAEPYTGSGLKIGGQTQQQFEQQKAYDTVLNSNSAEQIGKMAFDLNTPKDVQRAALDKLHGTMAVQQGMAKAQAIADKLGDSPDPRALNRAMNDKDTGSYFKVLMYQALGWTSKAKEELDKIDPKTTYGQTSFDGVNYRTKVNPNTNEILAAWDADGNPVNQKTLNKLGAEGFNAKAMGNVKELVKVGDQTIGVYQDGSMVDLASKKRYTGSLAGAEKITGDVGKAGATRVRDADNVEWSVVPTEKGSVFYDNSGNKGVPKGKTVPIQGGTDVELQAQLLKERSKAKLNDLIASLNAKNIAEPTTAANKLIAEFNAREGTDIKPGDIDWSRLKVSGGAVAPATTTTAGGAVAPAPTAAPATTAAPAPATTAAATTPAQPAEPPSQYSKLPPAPKYRERGFDTESQEAFKDRREAWSKTYGKMYESQQKNTKQAQSIFPDVAKMKTLIDQGTSSGIGAIVDNVGNFVGYSTSGAEAIAAIAPLASKILMSIERFEGPQSDKDVASYKEAAGRLADPTIPAAQKQAAFNTIIDIMRRNAPELDWDKALGNKPAAGGPTAGTRKTIPGRGTFEFDGKGWKPV